MPKSISKAPGKLSRKDKERTSNVFDFLDHEETRFDAVKNVYEVRYPSQEGESQIGWTNSTTVLQGLARLLPSAGKWIYCIEPNGMGRYRNWGTYGETLDMPDRSGWVGKEM
jgi:hypothetical protein